MHFYTYDHFKNKVNSKEKKTYFKQASTASITAKHPLECAAEIYIYMLFTLALALKPSNVFVIYLSFM